MNPVKPGIYTSEFWITLAINALHLANMLGWVPQGDNAMLQGEVGKIVTGAFAAVATVVYIWGRVVVKTR